MQAINLTDTDGNVIIDALFATSLSELPLANYCDYLPILEEYVSFVAEIDDTKLSIGNQFKSISIMAKAVAAWLDINVDNVMQLQLNESYDSESFNTCLVTLFTNTVNVVKEYEAKAIEGFEYNGVKYICDAAKKGHLQSSASKPGITTQQAFEILDTQRKVHNADAAKEDKIYHIYLEQLAVLCHKEGCSLPTDDIEARSYIDSQIKEFEQSEENKGINTGVALDVDFFFGGRLSLLNRTMRAVFFSIPSQGLRVALKNRKRLVK
jgi:hypothetical protein